MTQPWPGPADPIAEITYELMLGFDQEGQPVYGRGRVDDEQVLSAVHQMLAPLQPRPASLASVTMGEVELTLQSGARLTLRPVFHPSRDAYGDLFKIDHFDCPMPEALAERLNQWRAELRHEKSDS